MKLTIIAAVSLMLLSPVTVFPAGQVRAGSSEYRMFEKIDAEKNPDARIDLIVAFEKEFPQSKILSRVYLMAVDVYREKQDRAKINEYAEKALQFDERNITAMMLLARSYAMEAQNLDRAAELAQRALDRLQAMRKEPLPNGYSADQWNAYLKSNDESAAQILGYVGAVKGRSESMRKSGVTEPAGDPGKPPETDSAK